MFFITYDIIFIFHVLHTSYTIYMYIYTFLVITIFEIVAEIKSSYFNVTFLFLCKM